jgi:hypothetical protein
MVRECAEVRTIIRPGLQCLDRFTELTVRGSGHPRGMPLDTRMVARRQEQRRDTQWHPRVQHPVEQRAPYLHIMLQLVPPQHVVSSHPNKRLQRCVTSSVQVAEFMVRTARCQPAPQQTHANVVIRLYGSTGKNVCVASSVQL